MGYDEMLRQIKDSDLDSLVDGINNTTPGSGAYHARMAEITKRQTRAQLEATAAQVDAAQAAKETARYTKDVARNMFWSVLAVAASAVIALLSFAASVWF